MQKMPAVSFLVMFLEWKTWDSCEQLVTDTWWQVSATWYSEPGTECRVPGTRSGAGYLVHSTWYQVLVPGIEYLVSGTNTLKRKLV